MVKGKNYGKMREICAFAFAYRCVELTALRCAVAKEDGVKVRV